MVREEPPIQVMKVFWAPQPNQRPWLLITADLALDRISGSVGKDVALQKHKHHQHRQD